MCALCDPFDVEIAIHGPAQIRRVAAKLREAVRCGVLRWFPAGPGRAVTGQKPFMELDLESGLPDIMIYDFRCSRCGAVHSLEVGSDHGQGGTWSKL